MRSWTIRMTFFLGLALGGLFLWQISQVQAGVSRQLPTGSVATVTGTPVTGYVLVLDNEQGFANVRSGPGTLGYEIIGVLVSGQQAPAVGRTAVGEWIQIAYPGVPGGVAWVYKDLVDVQGNLPIVEPPPTMTPRTTPTVDPTLAAQFLVEVEPTGLPTYTAPPPLVIPTFVDASPLANPTRLPVGLIIIGMAVVGIFGMLITYLRGR
jgi:hypothetical protein